MVAAYRRAKNFNPVEIKKMEKSGDTQRCALPRGATLQRAAPRGAARRRVWLQKRRRAAPRAGV